VGQPFKDRNGRPVLVTWQKCQNMAHEWPFPPVWGFKIVDCHPLKDAKIRKGECYLGPAVREKPNSRELGPMVSPLSRLITLIH